MDADMAFTYLKYSFIFLPYRILASELWEQNITELVIRLKGHGIFEKVHPSAYVEIPVPIFGRGVNRHRVQELGYGARCIGASGSPPRLASYGTFIRGSTAATHPRVPTTATPSNARAYDYPRRIYGGYQPVSSRLDAVALRQGRYPTEQWTNNGVIMIWTGRTGCWPLLSLHLSS